MGMAIRNNLDALHIQNLYNKNTVGLSNSMYKVSSGSKINNAGDDPSGLALSQRIETRIDSYKQAHANVQNDSAIFKIADDALTNMNGILSSIRAKVVSGSNDHLSTADRTQLKTDIGQLITDYGNVIEEAKYNDKTFFKGNAGYVLDKFTAHYGADAGDKATFDFTALDDTALITTALGNATSASGWSNVITAVDTAMTKVYTMQGKLGSYEQRLGYMADNATNQVTALTELDSSIRDTNMAEGMTEFMKYNILTQSSQLMLAQAGQSPAMVLKLLEP